MVAGVTDSLHTPRGMDDEATPASPDFGHQRATHGLGRLRTILSRPDAVIFVGSGVSVWSGLPTWRGLISALATYLRSIGELADLVDRELAAGDLLQAASYGFGQLTTGQRCEFLRRTCRVGEARPSPLHLRIATLGPRCFITTNYDTLLESALRDSKPDSYFKIVSTTNLVESADILHTTAQDFVFKPHGDIGTCDSIVLTREDYRILHGPKRYVLETLRILLASRPVVFIGFGLRDPDFLLVKDTLALVYHGAAQDSYALRVLL
jgi:hypothetical protein